MSQFFIIAGKTSSLDGLSNVEVISLDRAEDVIVRAARDLFFAADWPSCWYLRDRGGCTGTLFTEAQAALLDGASFEQTRLYSLFSRTLPTAKGIALWYGDDWSDLPPVSESRAFLDRLRQDVERPHRAMIDS